MKLKRSLHRTYNNSQLKNTGKDLSNLLKDLLLSTVLKYIMSIAKRDISQIRKRRKRNYKNNLRLRNNCSRKKKKKKYYCKSKMLY
jgi:hypothetical protein